MKFEPTLPGNPNRLVINQHIFPRSAIQRFVASDGLVQVQQLAQDRIFPADPKNKVFCARRAWDQSTETFRSHPIEAAYGALADRIVRGDVAILTAEMDKTASEFFFLWNHRFKAASIPGEDATLNIADSEQALTKEQEETVEKKGGMFIRGNKVPFRFINGLSIMRETDRGMERLADAHWGIVRAAEGEFLVPDNSAGLCVIPVSPTICLVNGTGDVALTLEGVGDVNRRLKTGARNFIFARDLAQCPVKRSTIS
jgi:hypothetical protein